MANERELIGMVQGLTAHATAIEATLMELDAMTAKLPPSATRQVLFENIQGALERVQRYKKVLPDASSSRLS